SAKIDNLD
nr:Chain X, LEDGF peptide [Homo sapiens]3AV9_Y Chain Y, LEDGF peptide [Homo sapiens]